MVELFMGRNADGRLRVRDADWTLFLTQEVTPRFPDGMSIQDAYGQWRDSAHHGQIIHEPAKVIRILLPGDGSAQMDRIQAISRAYKERFAQQSVLRVSTDVCARF